MAADVLLSIAEVAIALAGFGGIAAGLGYRARGVWSEEDRVRLLGMAISSLVIVFACFSPYAIDYMGASPPWRVSATPLLVLQLGAFALSLRIFVSGLRAGGARPGGYSRAAGILGLIAQLSATFLLLALSLGYGVSREFGLYLTSVLLNLFVASTLFIRLLVASFRDEHRPAA